MTLDTTSQITFGENLAEPQYSCGTSQTHNHFETPLKEGLLLTQLLAEDRHENIKTQHRKNEGGANSDLSNTNSRLDGISFVENHLGKAQLHFDDNNIESAVDELIAASQRLKAYNSMVHNSVNTAITYLSTLGCRATPPHPKALSLVKIRQTLPT